MRLGKYRIFSACELQVVPVSSRQDKYSTFSACAFQVLIQWAPCTTDIVFSALVHSKLSVVSSRRYRKKHTQRPRATRRYEYAELQAYLCSFLVRQRCFFNMYIRSFSFFHSSSSVALRSITMSTSCPHCCCVPAHACCRNSRRFQDTKEESEEV